MVRKCVVVDTNCWVGVYLRPDGQLRKAVRKAIDCYGIVHSRDKISELTEVLSREKFDQAAPLDERLQFVATVADSGSFVVPVYNFKRCGDPKDDKFLDLAYSAGAACIISGDRHLRTIKHFMGIQIWTPAQFLARELAGDGMAPPLPDDGSLV